MNAREAVFQWMLEAGITTVFGNPGSTELPFLRAFPKKMRYVLALQEASVVAMADAYAQASGRPALVNVHTAPGLGNAVGQLVTAYENRSPLIVTAGQQDTRQLRYDPLLSGDLVGIARPYVKEASQAVCADELPFLFERAWLTAMTPPRGPVFLAIPMDFWDQPATPVDHREVTLTPHPAPEAMQAFASALNASAHPALVFGAGVDRSGAWQEAVALAERLGADVFSDAVGARNGFPRNHPQYKGSLAPAMAAVSQQLASYDVVLAVGAPVFRYYPYLPGPVLPPKTQLLLLTDDPQAIATAVGGRAVLGDIKAGLAILGGAVSQRPSIRVTVDPLPAVSQPQPGAPFDPAFVAQRLAEAMPEGCVLVDEAISNSAVFARYLRPHQPGGYYTAASGGLGFGVPAAIGIKLADLTRPVVAVVGDGSLQYTVQALYTAAQQQLPIVVLVLRNAEYNILKGFAAMLYQGQPGEIPGLDLPNIDIVGLAQAYGADAVFADSAAALDAALSRAFQATKPTVITVEVTSGPLAL